MNFFRRIYSFDYMGHKYWWFTLSAVIIAAGLISLFVKGGGNPVDGLNYGLEFSEGTRVAVAFEQSPSLAEVRQVVTEAGYGDAQIQQTANIANSGQSGFQIQTAVLSAEEQAALKSALNDKFKVATADGKEVWSLETVSASFGKQVISSSLKAVALALLLILIYVTFRFQWKFAIGAIGAEIHDLLIVVGVYSLTGQEGRPPRPSPPCSPSSATRSTTR